MSATRTSYVQVALMVLVSLALVAAGMLFDRMLVPLNRAGPMVDAPPIAIAPGGAAVDRASLTAFRIEPRINELPTVDVQPVHAVRPVHRAPVKRATKVATSAPKKPSPVTKDSELPASAPPDTRTPFATSAVIYSASNDADGGAAPPVSAPTSSLGGYRVVSVLSDNLALITATIHGRRLVSPYHVGQTLPDGKVITAIDKDAGRVLTAAGAIPTGHVTMGEDHDAAH